MTHPDRADDLEYRQLIDRFGGEIEQSGLSPDSGLGAALKLGADAAALARSRLLEDAPIARTLRVGIAQRQILNAAATQLHRSDAVTLFWPLPLTLQGVAAAIWAHPETAPWVGDVRALHAPDTEPVFPPGFDLYLAMLDKAPLDPTRLRSGVRKDHIEAIVAAGEDRWDAFLATFMGAIDFVWGHELAHVLYGHTAVARQSFGVADLFEAAPDEGLHIPPAMSQFMEHVADMDSALNLFTTFYGRLLEDRTPAVPDEHAMVGACTALGMVIAMYTLAQSSELAGRGHVQAHSHPPAGHRTAWILSAEVQAAEEMQRRLGVSGGPRIGHVREQARQLLRSVAKTHSSLDNWIMALDDDVEERTDRYLRSLRTAAEPHFETLDRYQLIGVKTGKR